MSQTITTLIINFTTVLLYTVIWGYCGYIFFTSILGHKTVKKDLIIYCVILTVMELIANYILIFIILAPNSKISFNVEIWESIFLLTNSTLMFVILRRRYLDNVWRTATAVALSQFMVRSVFYICNEISALVIQQYVTTESMWVSLVGSTIPYFLLLMGALMLKRLLDKIRFAHYFMYLFRTKLQCIVFALLSFFLMFSFIASNAILKKSGSSFPPEIASLLLMMFALALSQSIAVWRANQEHIQLQQETIAQQKAYVAVLEDFHSEVRHFRHDFQNILTGLALQADEGNLQQVKEFLNSSVCYMDDRLLREIKQMGCLSKVQPYSLKSLLVIKLAVAKEKHIDMSLSVLHNIHLTPLREVDLLRCLGILLDNALEEAARHASGMVTTILLQEHNELIIAITNTCPQMPNMAALIQDNYSTKGDQRGTGLASYRRILANYDCCTMRTFWDNGIFAQELHIQNRASSKNPTQSLSHEVNS